MQFDTKKAEALTLSSVIQKLQEGQTPQEQLGITDALLDRCYEIGCSYLDRREFSEAADIFLVVALLNPFIAEFWLRLGAAEAGCRRYEDALEAYSMAMLYDADDPFPHLYAAELYLHIERFADASKCVEIANLLIDESPEFTELSTFAQKLERTINEQMELK